MKRLVVFASFFAFGSANAQIISTEKTYDERLRGNALVTLGNDLFGDRINLKDGTVQFSQTDVSLPTKSNLRVEFIRHTPRQKQGLDRAAAPLGAGWEIDIPYMMGTYDSRRGWDARGSKARCSSEVLAPSEWVGPSPDYNTRVMPYDMYWAGIIINIPGAGYENMFKLPAGSVVPQDGTAYIGSTSMMWRVSCLSAIKNGTGEGFIVSIPNGDKYYFDWMATRNAADVLDSEYYRNSNGDGTNPTGLLVPTMDVFLYASKVEDRFGNYVEYNFDAANPHRLTSIVSNDGARIDVSYDAVGQVSEVRAGTSVWRYSYIDSYYGRKLSEVLLPDQSRWNFPIGAATHSGAMWWYMVPPLLPAGFYMNSCAQNASGFRSQDAPESIYVNTITMQHPSGAWGEFTMRSLIHGSDNTPGGCGTIGTSQSNFSFGSYGIPNAYMAKSLISKKIYGPGMADKVWGYAYRSRWSFASGCSSDCTSATTENRPDGSTVEYIFGNSYIQNYGDLISEKITQGGIILQEAKYVKAEDAVNYPSTYGNLIARGNPLSTKIRPLKEVSIRRNGINFVERIDNFDAMARPINIIRSSGP